MVISLNAASKQQKEGRNIQCQHERKLRSSDAKKVSETTEISGKINLPKMYRCIRPKINLTLAHIHMTTDPVKYRL